MVNGPLSFGNHLFENTVNILTFAIEELEQTIIESPATISDFEKRAYEGTEADIKRFVTVASLVEALDSLHAT